jgi:hypothetical protein
MSRATHLNQWWQGRDPRPAFDRMLKDTTRRKLLLITERRNIDRLVHAFARCGALLLRRVLLGYAGVGGFGRLGESARGGAGR